jgi:tetratricopeptide (TPR) repeat protein
VKKNLLPFFLCITFYTFSQNKELAYRQVVFDSDTCCWRKLSAEGKPNEAAMLIVNYIKKSPNAVNKHSLKWHAGQMYAAAGNNKKAIVYYKKTYNIFYKWFGDHAWYYYAKGNVAYLEKDRKKLRRIITLWDRKKLEKEKNYRSLEEKLSNLPK